MLRTKNTSTWFAMVLAIGLQGAPAHAQLARTHVSGVHGNDANDCNRLTPCRTFQKAHDSTLAAGEITVLDPGGYGALTITKAISIINDGVGEAGILVSGGLNGISINAGPSDAVSLRGLTVKGIGFGGGNGIVFNAGGSLTVEHCAIRTLDGGGTGVGIQFQPNTSSHLAVLNTIVADNSSAGIFVTPRGPGSVTASLKRVRLVKNGAAGLHVEAGLAGSTATLKGVVEDSLAARNSGAGFVVSGGSPPADVTLIRSIAAHNGFGIVVSATSRIGQSVLTGNAASWLAGGILQSYGDNYINGNGDGDPPIPTVIPTK